MRVLMTSWAWASHYLPLVPLGWALRAAGHEVRVASQPRLAPVITESGGVAVPTGPDLDHEAVHRVRMGATRLTAVPDAPAPGASTADWDAARRDKLRQVFGVFTAYSEAMLDDLLDFCRSWRPDLIVYDPTTYAGPLVAKALGIPAVRHVHGVDVTYQAREIVPDLVAPLARRLGLGTVDLLGELTVDPCPPSLQIATDTRRLLVRYIPYNGPAVLPVWLWQRPAGGRICITWGTSTTRLTGPDTFLPARLLAWTAGLSCEVVVSVTGADADLLGRVPDGVRLAPDLPLHLLLPTCDAVIHQGGNGTLLTAASFGVPQLALPQLPDQAFQAARLADVGAGLMLRKESVEAGTVLEATQALLSDSGYRDAAASLRADMLAQATPAEIVAELELVAGR